MGVNDLFTAAHGHAAKKNAKTVLTASSGALRFQIFVINLLSPGYSKAKENG